MNIQPKLYFHFVKSLFSEMPCINSLHKQNDGSVSIFQPF